MLLLFLDFLFGMPYQLPPPCYPIIFPLSPSVLLPHSHSSFSVPSIYYSITMSITPRSRYRSCFNLILQSLLNTIRPFTPPSSRYICYSLSLSRSLSLLKVHFLKNGPTRPLFHLFWSFQTHITIFYNK